MSDRQLRSDLIRLASRSTPEVRKALLPLLSKKASGTPKTAGGFVRTDTVEEACKQFVDATGLRGIVNPKLLTIEGKHRVPVPGEFQSLFRGVWVEVEETPGYGTTAYWHYAHPQGGSNGIEIGTIHFGSADGLVGYRLSY